MGDGVIPGGGTGVLYGTVGCGARRGATGPTARGGSGAAGKTDGAVLGAGMMT